MLRTHDQVFTTNTRPIEMDNPVPDLRFWKLDNDYELWADEIEAIETRQAGGHDGNEARR